VTEPLLEVKRVVKVFDGLPAVDDASFQVERGTITALIGPNGAGKTTLFNVISRFQRADQGEVWFDGRRIDRWPPHEIVDAGLARTFQLTKILTKMTVLDNMMVAGRGQPGERLLRVVFTPRVVRNRERQIREQAMHLLNLVRLDTKAHAYAGELSGGQCKLLEFARALMTGPRMIMLDEPMAGVNPALGLELLGHVTKLRDEQGMTFLFIEHDMEIVMTISKTVIVMNEGKVISEGTPEYIRKDERVIDAYLGRRETAGQGVAADGGGP
jgi:neutral amino acid transport system ATP-binding protein